MRSQWALVCAPYVPPFDRESGAQRMFDLTCLLREAGWNVAFVANDGTGGEAYARLLRQRGVAVYLGPHTKFAGVEYLANIRHLLNRTRFDIALCFFWQIAEAYIDAIRECSPETRVIVDSVDLHFLRNSRRLLRRSGSGPISGRLDGHFLAELSREVDAYVAADAVLTVSQKEADLLNDFVNDPTLCLVVPDAEDLPQSTVPMADRKGIVFIGNFRHPPNLEALEYLCQDILPLLDPSVLSEHPLYIIGNAVDDRVRSLVSGLNGVQLVGWVPSVLPYLQHARISVTPLLHGAGTKRKLLQSMMVGTPSVSTSIGTEGLDVRNGEHVLVADDPTAFARAIERLVNDAELSTRLAAQGSAHVTARHGRGLVRDCWLGVVSSILARPTKQLQDGELVNAPADIT